MIEDSFMRGWRVGGVVTDFPLSVCMRDGEGEGRGFGYLTGMIQNIKQLTVGISDR